MLHGFVTFHESDRAVVALSLLWIFDLDKQYSILHIIPRCQHAQMYAILSACIKHICSPLEFLLSSLHKTRCNALFVWNQSAQKSHYLQEVTSQFTGIVSFRILSCFLLCVQTPCCLQFSCVVTPSM